MGEYNNIIYNIGKISRYIKGQLHSNTDKLNNILIKELFHYSPEGFTI